MEGVIDAPEDQLIERWTVQVTDEGAIEKAIEGASNGLRSR